MAYNLNQLWPQSFTEPCRALLHHGISERVTPEPLFGRDAGIDTYYEGPGQGRLGKLGRNVDVPVQVPHRGPAGRGRVPQGHPVRR